MRLALVVPCFNEARRLDAQSFRSFVDTHPHCHLQFVDDGSTDDTLRVLEGIRSHRPEQIRITALAQNAGKAEAVRRGLLEVLKNDPDFVAYWDADLATPLEASQSFVGIFKEREDVEMVFGARVKLMGRDIQRRKRRHYLGRVFATCASIALSLSIYDTQCGAKMFRVNPTLRQLLQEPFHSRWIFDVEIIARFLHLRKGASRANIEASIYEYPLMAWRDVHGSKVSVGDGLRAFIELAQIHWRYR